MQEHGKTRAGSAPRCLNTFASVFRFEDALFHMTIKPLNGLQAKIRYTNISTNSTSKDKAFRSIKK